MKKFYVGTNIKELIGKEVTVLGQVDLVNEVPVYNIVTPDGEIRKVFEFSLSDECIIPETISVEEMKELLPPSVPTFPTFSPNGRYLYDNN